MRLVRLLPSLDDEVNCATWSPVPGEGIVYGTKEGKLRMLRHDR
jgi:activator-of-BECN1-regulated-autophagy protein 1